MRPPRAIAIGLAVVFGALFLAPIHDFCIECQPDGTSLGTIRANEIRVVFATIIAAAILLAAAVLSKRWRLWAAIATSAGVGWTASFARYWWNF